MAILVAAPAAAAAGLTTTQLPRTARPTHYDLAVVPDAEAMAFRGEVKIAVDVLEPTASLTLNALGLSFETVRLEGGGRPADSAPPTVRVDAELQTVTFGFDPPVAPGSYQLAVSYTGKIGTQAVGFFALDYDTAEGRRRMLLTQFEAADARRFVPSWDEPAYKATFTLESVVPGGQLALSNMPVEKRTELDDGSSRIRFATSPKMSTYLLFFGVGDLERVAATTDGVEVGVVTRKGAAAQAAFVLASSQAILHEYNEYFGAPYPLPKLDTIAGPGRAQFFSAMENWGAIMTFEHAILLDPTISTEADRQRAFQVAAHEISHQWFGNLVTMSWWDDLWLNEGFASWMGNRITESLHPEWSTALDAVESREGAMNRDSLATTHAVVQHVETVAQTSQAFDGITYGKGRAVIRMLEGYVGDEAWRAGVRRYIQKHAYGNTVTDDLWREMEAVAGKPILAIARDFTQQPGVPLIAVEDVVCGGGKTSLRLVQREFSRDQPHKRPLSWRVPVAVAVVGGGEPVQALVTEGAATVTVPGCGPVVVNAGQRGYFRTLYRPRELAAVAKRFPTMAPADQLGILADAWALGLGGLQPATDALDLAAATPADANPKVWERVAVMLASLDEYYRGDGTRQETLRRFGVDLLAPVWKRVGWVARAGEPEPVAILRDELIDTLGLLGDAEVVGEARRRYAAQASDPTAMPPSLRKTILGVVARHADAATWDQLHAAARGEKTPLVKDRLYQLLASAEDEGLARRALELALTPEPGATNTSRMISVVSELHPDLAFDFALANRPAVEERVDASSLSRYFPALARGSANPEMVGKVSAYASAHLPASARREAETAVATIVDRIRVRREQLPAIDAWLARHSRVPPPTPLVLGGI